MSENVIDEDWVVTNVTSDDSNMSSDKYCCGEDIFEDPDEPTVKYGDPPFENL